jgi:hypothetical protein
MAGEAVLAVLAVPVGLLVLAVRLGFRLYLQGSGCVRLGRCWVQTEWSGDD